MVDVSTKQDTLRQAVAESVVLMPKEVLVQLQDGKLEKGDPLVVAELAGIMAAKRTAELIPLCHPLPLSKVSVRGTVYEGGVRFESLCKTTGKTGVEMEALTAASVAALTLYDMLKGITKGMELRCRLLSKEGGMSGTWQAEATSSQ